MKRIVTAIPLIAILLLAAGADAQPPKLTSHQARFEVSLKVSAWAVPRGLFDDKGVKCKRKNRNRMRCVARVSGDFPRKVRQCDVVVRVAKGSWRIRSVILRKSCRNVAKPWLTETDARAAIMADGDGQGPWFGISWLIRVTDTRFDGMVQWNSGTELPNGRECSANVRVERLPAGVKVWTWDPFCY